ncbi:MAG: lipid-binding SYLF domain-containing protein [Deltaproteobacteria bacterium]|nr:lipid-binding SYLF domain-containing protein [Deltaproteobacteria bacterium]
MKNFNLKSGKLSRLLSLTAAITLLLCVGGLDSARAASEKEIDSKADAALERLYKLDGGKEFAGKAKGMLVLPNVGKGALIVGFEHGKGALRIDGKTVDYYSLSAGSVGLQIGGEAKDIIIAFLTTEAMDKFRNSKNWEAGVDGNIAMIAAGDGGSLTNISGKEPIKAVVIDVKGLFLDMSLKGAKFSKLKDEDLDK